MARLADGARKGVDLITGGQLADMTFAQAATQAENRMAQVSTFDADYVGMEMLLGNGDKPVRSRAQLYQKYHFMMQEGMISTALRNNVQMALGGHETTGETIFLEPKPKISSADKKMLEELAPIVKMLNDSCHSMGVSATGFGDAYAKLYVVPKEGIVAFDHESILSPIVQPYVELGRTVGYVVSLGEKMQSRVSPLEMVRWKMPRMGFVSQFRALENAQKINLEAKSLRDVMPLPDLVGGSLLEAAEHDFDNLYAAIRGLVGQRIASSIEEVLLSMNLADTTKEQRERITKNTVKMLTEMKARAEKQISEGIYSTSRNFNIMPVWNDKQLTQVSSIASGASGQNLGVEDVMFHAKKLAGTLGTDISQMGFADLLSGGLGDGGSNRTSAMGAERARMLRTSYTNMANDTIDRHMLAKYGKCWPNAERPYTINFYGAIAALEAEKQISAERAMNKAAILVQIMAQLRELGLPQDTVSYLLAKVAEMDTEAAETFAKGLANAKPPVQPGFGGGGDNDMDLLPGAGGGNNDDEDGQQ
ncbi:hypothetical protein KVG88_30345 [Pseudomonas sp. SWRI74]|uniref:Portal protein n=1 Tax=Pseudomonas azerbaijanoccidentalis TaxID=2842347 RepID=A0ABS6QZL4_9PSED|nr:hypothetical protein [Pseudomonas azerbaijanoccidentalis]MBV4524377.1 hypothetical protein [Pseudomonas azerbaijanoccidentalis]